jgi:hypothetical protein
LLIYTVSIAKKLIYLSRTNINDIGEKLINDALESNSSIVYIYYDCMPKYMHEMCVRNAYNLRQKDMRLVDL